MCCRIPDIDSRQNRKFMSVYYGFGDHYNLHCKGVKYIFVNRKRSMEMKYDGFRNIIARIIAKNNLIIKLVLRILLAYIFIYLSQVCETIILPF